MNHADHCTHRVRWSGEDGEFVGTVAELPSLSWLDADRALAFEGIQELAGQVVADMVSAGETPPAAIADREYSGKFMIRVPPELHRQLVLEAAEQHVSLNRPATLRLVGSWL